MSTTIGKAKRIKDWVSDQGSSGGQIDSFDDFSKPQDDDDDDDDDSGSGGDVEEEEERDDEDEDGQGLKATIDPTKNWEAFEELVRRSTMTSKTSVRVDFLNNVLAKHLRREVFTPQQTSSIIKILIPTYSRYIDMPSRRAVLSSLQQIIATDLKGHSGKLTEVTLKWIDNEVGTKICSPTSFAAGTTILGMLSWISTVYETVAKTLGPEGFEKQANLWTVTVRNLAVCYDALHTSNVKASVKKGGALVVRRAVRENAQLIPLLLKTLSSSSLTKPPTATAALLGLSVDVAIRLKVRQRVKEGQGKEWVDANKASILGYYRDNILASRTALPPHQALAFNDFIGTSVSEDDLAADKDLVKAMERSLMRNPEISLTTIDVFFTAYVSPVTTVKGASPPQQRLPPQAVINKLLPQILASAKSSNALTRSSASLLFNTLVSPWVTQSTDASPVDTTFLVALAKEAGTPLKTVKSASPDHRVALSNLLLSFTSAREYLPAVLIEIVDSICPSIAKEANEAALKATLQALVAALLPLIRANSDKTKTATSAILKGCSDVKVNMRRQYLEALGSVFWKLASHDPDDEPSSVVQELAKSALPALDNALKNASGANAALAVEGWIAVATLKGPLKGFKVVEPAISKNAALAGVLTVGAKPSFLLAEKSYKKVADANDESWLVRAAESVFNNEGDLKHILGDANLRLAASQPLIHVAIESPHHENRRLALKAISKISLLSSGSASASTVFIDGLTSWLRHADKTELAISASQVEDVVSTDRAPRLQSVATAVARAIRTNETVAVDLLVLSHHASLAPQSRSLWIEAVLAASRDPATIATRHQEELLAQVWKHTAHSSRKFADAAFRAISTLIFVAPDAFLPAVTDRIVSALDPSGLAFVGETEMGIYNTPEGETFVDVLASSNKGTPTATKGKGAALDKWDQETRAALAAKKKTGPANGAPTLSKAERALVDARLRKEAETRQQIVDALNRVHQGLHSIRSILDSRADEKIPLYIPRILTSLLAAVKGSVCRLYAEEAFQTFVKLYESCSPRISDVRLSMSLAVLRAEESPIVPEDFQAEPLALLVTRVLYRLRFQSDQTPFDASTFALASPLLNACIYKEGLGIEKGDNDAVAEQLALVIDVIAFHVRQFNNVAFPRLATIKALIAALLSFPSLSKSSSDALVDLGSAIEENASKEEIDALLKGLMVDEAQVRHACLQALAPLDLTEWDYSDELWIVTRDTDERNARLALTIWEDNGLDVKDESVAALIPFLHHSSTFVRSATAVAIAAAVGQLPHLSRTAIDLLSDDYKEAARERLPEYDRFGMLIEASLHQQDPWQARVAQAEALQHLAPYFSGEEIMLMFRLLIQQQALADRSESVRSKMLDAGIAAIDIHGRENLQPLMEMFEGYLAQKAPSNETTDLITESVVVLFGRLAGHLEANDERIASVIDRLLVALKTPSEVVQIAVSECLPPLIRANKEKGAATIEQLLRETLHAAKYAERRGAAYGLAGAVKGRGLTAIKEFDIVTRLQDATEDKKNTNARQGAIFAFETLSSTLGRLFEPYIIKILPILLTCLGDSSLDVREATTDAARVIMSKISGHAVKLILPSLLSALEDRQWRTKKGAIELMGTMAYLAPRQLSQSLPTIIPPLTEVLTDTHTQVRAAANASLKKFGEVVDNPEIKAMQSTLLGALVDPTKKTGKALDTLLTTSFVHYIDTSSLALIVPIIDRGLRERSAEIKRKGAQIVGNMASLTDSKDLIPYLPQLIPRVRDVLIDPVPEARATAAKCLGVLIERLGEDAFPTMVEDLMATLKSDASGVDQQGAAQGLSEVLSGLGVERMEHMLPEIINNTSSPRAYVREGFISLLIYLPSVFGERFSPYLGRIIQPVLGGLADESEYVREASMRAGRMIVANHSTKAIDLLLPELERGLFDSSWRIRLSSIQLVGELLFRISGISGKSELEGDAAEEEEDTYTSNSEAARKLLEVLGKEKRDRVLASLYILRQDSAGQVRTFSLNVWKALVNNTPRTVRDMLPSLMQIIIRLLASQGPEQQETAARTLGELCRKQGERILGDIIPILRQASEGSVSSRQGCCLAIAEILEATTKTQLEGHEDAIIESVRGSLVDESPLVRQAAAQAFDALQSQVGPRSIDQTIPTLLGALTQTQEGGASEAALSALKELMAVRAQAIFPILIPTLIAPPISSFNAKALASLVEVAGSALNRRVAQILDALQKNYEDQQEEEVRVDLDAAIRSVLASISDTEGLHMLMLHLLGLAKDTRTTKRVGGCDLFAIFCQVTDEDFSAYHVDWLRQLVSLLDDSQENVVDAAGRAIEALSKTLTKDQMEALSVPLRRTIESGSAAGQTIAGFCRPGGLKPILPILIQGLLAGTNEQREQSAYGLGDIVERTATDALKPYVTQITGPLIRIIAERYPPPVKAAILSTLAVLLTKVPQFVRPFFPQLQRTFVKNLSDPASGTVRTRAATGLGVLMGLQPRIDPLITELVNGASHDEQEVREAMANALGLVILSGGQNIGPAARESIAELVRATLEEPGKENFNNAIARVLAAMVKHDMPQAEALVAMCVESKGTPISSVSLLQCLEMAPEQLYKHNPARVAQRVLKNIISDHPGTARPAREAKELLKKTEPWSLDEDLQAKLA